MFSIFKKPAGSSHEHAGHSGPGGGCCGGEGHGDQHGGAANEERRHEPEVPGRVDAEPAASASAGEDQHTHA